MAISAMQKYIRVKINSLIKNTHGSPKVISVLNYQKVPLSKTHKEYCEDTL